MLGLGLALIASPAQALLECDRNGDDVVDAQEARFCAELDFDELRGEGEAPEEQQFSGAGQRIMPTFAEIDETATTS